MTATPLLTRIRERRSTDHAFSWAMALIIVVLALGYLLSGGLR